MFLKNYFGREETKSVTKELVGSILEEEITEIDLEQNPILEKNIKDEKIGILDIRAKLNKHMGKMLIKSYWIKFILSMPTNNLYTLKI